MQLVMIFDKMPLLIDPKLEAGVLTFRQLNYSLSAIVSHYSRLGMSISRSAVGDIVQGKGKRRVCKAKGGKISTNKNLNSPSHRANRGVAIYPAEFAAKIPMASSLYDLAHNKSVKETKQ